MAKQTREEYLRSVKTKYKSYQGDANKEERLEMAQSFVLALIKKGMNKNTAFKRAAYYYHIANKHDIVIKCD